MRRWLPPASTVDGVVWPPILTGAHATLAALVHHLEVSQWLPREQIERLQRAQLARLAEHCAQHSPHFRLRLRESELKAADLAEPGGLERLAPLTRRRIQRAGAHLFCDRVPEGHLPLGEGKTSGSTGEPVVVMRSALSRLHWFAMTLREHFWFARDFREPLHFAARVTVFKHEVAAIDVAMTAETLHQRVDQVQEPIRLIEREKADARDLACGLGPRERRGEQSARCNHNMPASE